MSLVKFTNGKKNNPLMPGFSEVFENLFNEAFSDRMLIRMPAVNISETPESYYIELAAPGLKKDDFKIRLDKDILSISVERSETSTDKAINYLKREYSYGSFVRSFSLPDSIDDQHIDAMYTNGVLHINIAKKEEAKSVTRKIEIK